MSDYKAASRAAMHRKISSMNSAKILLKSMIIGGFKVSDIKKSLKESGLPVGAYQYWLDRGLVHKWRESK